MKGRDRNSECWCGSGKKYKKCHLNRHIQPTDNPWDALSINRKAFSQKKCCAKEVGLGKCEGKIIKAHTISRSRDLSKIAKDGHVLHYGVVPSEIKRHNKSLPVKKIGIRDASVFYGFCEKHDRELFSCIENKPFIGSPQQCLHAAYRIISRELYGKDAGTHLSETLRGADKGTSLLNQIAFQARLNEISTGNEAARRELEVTHKKLTSALVQNSPESMSSLILEFKPSLPFMFAGAWTPFTDLFDRKLQDGYSKDYLEQVIASSYASHDTTTICFSWLKTESMPGKVIAEQIEKLPSHEQASACLQIIAKHVENIFYDPDWFYSLGKEQKQQIDKLAFDGMDVMGSPPSVKIITSMNFDLPHTIKVFQS